LGPIVVVGLAKQFDEPLALAAGGRLLEGHLEQDGIPPADLVVAVITDYTWVVAQRENLLAGHLVHSIDDFRVPHVPPRRAGGRADVEDGREEQIRVASLAQGFKIAPSTNGGEAPVFETPQSGLRPRVGIRVMLPRCVAGVGGVEFVMRSAWVHTTDA